MVKIKKCEIFQLPQKKTTCAVYVSKCMWMWLTMGEIKLQGDEII